MTDIDKMIGPVGEKPKQSKVKTRRPTMKEALLIVEGLGLHAYDVIHEEHDDAVYLKKLLDQVYTIAHVATANCCKGNKEFIREAWECKESLEKMGVM